MSSGGIERLIEFGEGPNLEFKAAVTDANVIARTVSSFLNSKGGQLILGVDDHGKVRGVASAQKIAVDLERSLFQAISPSPVLSVTTIPTPDGEIIEINAPEGSDKPYIVDGAAFVRRGPRTVAARREDMSAMILARGAHALRWERQFTAGAELGDLDFAIVKSTMEVALSSGRWHRESADPEEFLHSLGLIEGGSVTNGAMVLFGGKPARFIPQVRVRMVAMPEGKTGTQYARDLMFDRCLLRTAADIEKALEADTSTVDVAFRQDRWRREEGVRYPGMALREGVLNALVHRDYAMTGTILISVLGDGLTIDNPGGLPEGIAVADLKRNHPSMPRNPDIAHVFFLNGLIEKVGRGTQLIAEACKVAGLRQPRWESGKTSTMLRFRGRGSSVPKGRDAVSELNARQLALLAKIRAAGRLTAREAPLQSASEVSDRTVRSDLAALVKAGLVRVMGKARAAFYVPTTAKAEES